MICSDGNTVRMTRGDFGIPLPIRVTECCVDCVDGLLDEDVLRVTVARGDMVYVTREKAFGALQGDSGTWVLTLTEDEAKAMPPGRYRWSVALLRAGVLRNTLLGPELWEVR